MPSGITNSSMLCGCEEFGQMFCDHNVGVGDGACTSCSAVHHEEDCDDLTLQSSLHAPSCKAFCFYGKMYNFILIKDNMSSTVAFSFNGVAKVARFFFRCKKRVFTPKVTKFQNVIPFFYYASIEIENVCYTS